MKSIVSLVKKILSCLDFDRDTKFRWYGRTSYAKSDVVWKKTGNGIYPYETHFNGHHLMVRVNDFPAEGTMYSLLEDGDVIDDFMNIPKNWQIED